MTWLITPHHRRKRRIMVVVFAVNSSFATECVVSERMRLPSVCVHEATFLRWQAAHLQPAPRGLGGSCAVVGAAGSMRGARWGRRIDKHDTVIRVNHAPVRGYEGDVGSRTDARVMSMDEFASDPQYPLNRTRKQARHWRHSRRREPPRRPPLLLVSCHRPFTGRCTLRRMNAAFEGAAGNAHLLSVDLARRAARHFRGVRHRSPTAGFLAVELAMALCANVTLYGFADGSCAKRCYHYYSCKYRERQYFANHTAASEGYHDFTAQARVLRALNASSSSLHWPALPRCPSGGGGKGRGATWAGVWLAVFVMLMVCGPIALGLHAALERCAREASLEDT